VKCGWIVIFAGGVALVLSALVLPALAEISDTDLAFLESSAPLSRPVGYVPSLWRPVLGVLLIALLLGGSLYLSYRRKRQETGSDLIQVLAASAVAQGVIVQVVDVGGVLYVMAISRSGPVLLGQITEREKISEIRHRVSAEASSLPVTSLPFQKAFGRFFRRAVADSESPSKRPARDSLLQESLERLRRLNPTDKDK